jgi:hypothetical protein
MKIPPAVISSADYYTLVFPFCIIERSHDKAITQHVIGLGAFGRFPHLFPTEPPLQLGLNVVTSISP